jgi:hypothetical protein
MVHGTPPEVTVEEKITRHTFSIALLVRTPLNPFFPFLPLRIDALFRDAVFDTAETGSCVIAFLAGFLAVSACVLDLPTLRTKRLSGQEVGRERVHVHRVPYGRYSYGELNRVIRMRVKGIVAIGALVISRGHEMGREQKSRLGEPEDRRNLV